ncbi:RNA polymerase sigma factor [Nocardioides abyssi]|uniref:RNA polymerase sigma factor n=1 Tax=Nocardioides abyssi TaxID=3058370 RepID=A0ABT8EYZ4_9ACTN|nr:RNA polymerase sigma factor [Nocardioides abyssi]MDN4163407.1 RNA polymerase sigma factor [Nocardioides abyssi]
MEDEAAVDRELLARVAEGDRGALRELFDRHQPWLAARVRQRCGDPAVVAEVVNDTFLVAWQQPGRYAGRGEVAAWLWGIALRTLLQRLRARKPVLERLARLRPEHAPSAEEAVLLAVEHSDVGRALQRLSPELLAVVQATVLDGLSTREAAALLGIPSGTVKSRMSRARLELREALL